MFENRQLAVLEEKCRRFRNSSECFRFTVPRIIDQFGHKRCQKKRKDVGYKLILEYFQKCFTVHEQLAVKNSLSTYICMLCSGCFILNGIVHTVILLLVSVYLE